MNRHELKSLPAFIHVMTTTVIVTLYVGTLCLLLVSYQRGWLTGTRHDPDANGPEGGLCGLAVVIGWVVIHRMRKKQLDVLLREGTGPNGGERRRAALERRDREASPPGKFSGKPWRHIITVALCVGWVTLFSLVYAILFRVIFRGYHLLVLEVATVVLALIAVVLTAVTRTLDSPPEPE